MGIRGACDRRHAFGEAYLVDFDGIGRVDSRIPAVRHAVEHRDIASFARIVADRRAGGVGPVVGRVPVSAEVRDTLSVGDCPRFSAAPVVFECEGLEGRDRRGRYNKRFHWIIPFFLLCYLSVTVPQCPALANGANLRTIGQETSSSMNLPWMTRVDAKPIFCPDLPFQPLSSEAGKNISAV